MNDQKPDKLKCESCGKDFLCGANIGKCWCFELELKADKLVKLQDNYKNCLCQDCLEKIQKSTNFIT